MSKNFFLQKRDLPLIIAHRGANNHAPENTLAAFSEALRLKADAIELDIQLSSDKAITVFHDATLDRMTNGRGRVEAQNFGNLQRLKITTGPNWEELAQTIPLLDTVLKEFGHKIAFQIELKSFYGIRHNAKRRKLVHETIKIIKQHRLEDQVMLKSFDPFTIKEIKAKSPSIVCGLLLVPGLSHLRHVGITRTAFNLAEIIEPRNLTQSFVEQLHRKGKRVITWTVDDPELAAKATAWKIDGIITNTVDDLKS